MRESYKKQKALKMFNKGQEFLRVGSLNKAFRCYEIAYMNGYAQHESFIGMGQVSLYQLNLYAALEHFNRVLIHADASTGVNYFIGLCYYYFGSDTQAYEHFYKALKNARNHLLRLKAFEFLDQRNQITDEDREQLLNNDLVVNMDATLDRLSINQCNAYLERIQGNFETSNEYLTALIPIFPNVYLLYLEIAKNHAGMNDLNQALVYYQKAMSMAPEDVSLAYGMSKILYELQDFHACRKVLKRLTHTIVSNYKLYYNLANTCYQLEKYAESVKYYKLSAENNPNFFKTFYNLGTVSLKVGQLEEAENNLNVAQTLNKLYGGTFYNIGILYFMQKRYQEAIQYFMQAKDLNEANEKYFHNLNVAKGIKLIDPKEKIQHQIPFLINVLLFAVSIFLIILIIYLLKG